MKEGRNEDRPTLAGSVATNAAQLRLAARSACGKCGARRVDQQIGLEESPAAYAARLVEVFQEVRRILHPSGLLLLNLGDSFAGGKTGRSDSFDGRCIDGRRVTRKQTTPPRPSPVPPGLKAKDLLGIPWLVAFALRDDGWYLRCAPPLVKDNCMPESVQDRPTTAHEYWFMLAKSARYFWDADAVRVPMTKGLQPTYNRPHKEAWAVGPMERGPNNEHHQFADPDRVWGNPAGRNLRTSDVFYQGLDDLIERERAWLAHLEHVRAQGGMLLDREGDPLALLYPTFAFPGAHFATFSPHMIMPLLKAATSERGCCPACRAPWVREVKKGGVVSSDGRSGTCGTIHGDHVTNSGFSRVTGGASYYGMGRRERAEVGWHPSCACPPANPVPALCLDPFAGSGTVGLVARRLGRRFVGFDLNEQYVTLARQRIESDAPLFNGAAPAPAPVQLPDRTLFDPPPVED
jgi:hypothetical protein